MLPPLEYAGAFARPQPAARIDSAQTCGQGAGGWWRHSGAGQPTAAALVEEDRDLDVLIIWFGPETDQPEDVLYKRKTIVELMTTIP